VKSEFFAAAVPQKNEKKLLTPISSLGFAALLAKNS
jgi:hypothetical protein